MAYSSLQIFNYSLAILFLLLTVSSCTPSETNYILNVSYDPTRELFQEINPIFSKNYFLATGKKVEIKQSHGGSSKQAGYVLAGLRADVVTLALFGDIDAIAKKGFIDKNWEDKRPNQSSPYTSTVVFLVRKGNPKQIFDWSDLTKTGVQIITPNPKTSGGGKWNFLAAYGYSLLHNNKNKEKSFTYLKALYKNVPVMDTGARGAASTFIQRGIGDVLLVWENEAFLAMKEAANATVEVVYPSLSIDARPVVSVVDRTLKLKKTTEPANAYLDFLYTDEAQEIIAKHGFRPYNKAILEKYKTTYKPIQLFSIEDYFTNWATAEKDIFADNKIVDEVLK
jgi:sulfate/thiosulfate transport system substrate-binding protein